MKNLLFTFLNIDLQNIFISLIIYRDINSIYITNIITKKTTRANMLVINNNYDINNNIITITKKRNKESSENFHTYSHVENLTRV